MTAFFYSTSTVNKQPKCTFTHTLLRPYILLYPHSFCLLCLTTQSSVRLRRAPIKLKHPSTPQRQSKQQIRNITSCRLLHHVSRPYLVVVISTLPYHSIFQHEIQPVTYTDQSQESTIRRKGRQLRSHNSPSTPRQVCQVSHPTSHYVHKVDR